MSKFSLTTANYQDVISGLMGNWLNREIDVGQLLRFQIFSLIAFTQFLIYMLMIYLSVFHQLIPDFYRFWFEESIFNTFNVFVLFTIIQFMWLLSESIFLIKSGKIKWINTCVLASCGIFVVHIFFSSFFPLAIQSVLIRQD